MLVSVQLQTDLSPRNEFMTVRTIIGDEQQTEPVGDTESYLEPVQVAELQVPTGTNRIRVQLLDFSGRLVAERLLIAEVRTDSAFVVFIGASCRDVICSGEDQTCIEGTCRGATEICGGRPCTPDDCIGGVCGMACETTADCTPLSDGCSDPDCREKVCVGIPRDGSCAPGFYCAVGIGCISVPPDVNPDGGVPEGGIPEGGIPDGGDGGVMSELCPCMALCGTTGTTTCMGGVPTGPCTPPEEDCGLGDEDCDTRIDEGLDCSHSHPIVCQVGLRMLPDMTFTRNIASIVTGGGPGLICAGGVCQSFLNNCETLPTTGDSHIHSVTIGGGAGLTVLDDTPFSASVRVSSAAGHGHGGSCGIGSGGAREIVGGIFYHRILDDGGDPMLRYDMFCEPPVGSPDSECRTGFGYCQTE